MQSIFRLAWCTDSTGDDKPEKTMFTKMRQPPVVDIPLFSKLKRKRSGSPSFEPVTTIEDAKRRKLSGHDCKGVSLPGKRQPDTPIIVDSSKPESHSTTRFAPPQQSTVDVPLLTPENSFIAPNSVAKNAEPTPPPSAKFTERSCSSEKPDVSEGIMQSHLQDVIDHQFNLEILLKHRELRLIEQELAKCQAALEQLRRCEIIPYPGVSGLSESLSTGTGPALGAQPGYSQPQAPAPWGVTDGPYTRHYAKWLLNDPTFDSVPLNSMIPAYDNFAVQSEGRATRNSGSGPGKTSRSRSIRDSFGNLNQSLPNYPTQPRGKQGPLVIRRLADNQFVKLICNNCQRGDFSSVQGFLNHCRIAHKVDYKSHEAAALDCGKVLEEDESHLVPQNTAVATTKAPKQQQAPKSVATPVVPAPLAGFVHPLNAPVLPRYTWKIQAEAARASASKTLNGQTKSTNKIEKSPASASFHATPLIESSSAPYLSARFAKRGLGGDLQRVTSQAREKVDLGPEVAEDDELMSAASETPKSNGISCIGVSRPMFAPAHDGSHGHKGRHQPTSRPRPSPIMPRHVPSSSVEAPDSPHDSNLSPHAVDSNPGLVSDHEDDDGASDLDEAQSERHQSPGAVSGLGALRSRACGDGLDAELEVDVDDEADGHSVLIRPRSLGLQMRSSGSPSGAK